MASSLTGKVAVVTGASRGIGRAAVLAFAGQGMDVVITAKSVTETEGLEGTIHSVAEEARALGVRALPFQLDVRDAARVDEVVALAAKELGPPAVLLNNASALWWKPMEHTPMERFDLIHQINARGTFAMTRACLPHMREAGFGHVITQSPPIALDRMAGMVGYNMSKFGMTLTALGVAAEYRGKGVAGNSIWPTTLVESAATRNHQLGEPKHWRTAAVLTDAILAIAREDPREFTGNMLLDEPYLRSKGVQDFAQYQCVPGHEPPKLEEVATMLMGAGSDSIVSRTRK
eukprot:g3634.t1